MNIGSIQKFLRLIVLRNFLFIIIDMIENTFHGTVVGKKVARYTVYVFRLDNGSFEMCTLLPNWGQSYILNIGDSGFATVVTVKAGEQYYERLTGEQRIYQYDKTYLQEFIKDKEENKIIL